MYLLKRINDCLYSPEYGLCIFDGCCPTML